MTVASCQCKFKLEDQYSTFFASDEQRLIYDESQGGMVCYCCRMQPPEEGQRWIAIVIAQLTSMHPPSKFNGNLGLEEARHTLKMRLWNIDGLCTGLPLIIHSAIVKQLAKVVVLTTVGGMAR